MRRPIVDSIVGCSDTAADLGTEIDLFPCRGKTIRKRMNNLSVGLNMAPIRRHRKQSVGSSRRSRGLMDVLRSGPTRKSVRCGTFPQRCISQCAETYTVAESSHLLCGEVV